MEDTKAIQIQSIPKHDTMVYKCSMCNNTYICKDILEQHELKHNFDDLKHMSDELLQKWLKSEQKLDNNFETQKSFVEMHHSMVKLTNSIVQDNLRDILLDNLFFKEIYLRDNSDQVNKEYMKSKSVENKQRTESGEKSNNITKIPVVTSNIVPTADKSEIKWKSEFESEFPLKITNFCVQKLKLIIFNGITDYFFKNKAK